MKINDFPELTTLTDNDFVLGLSAGGITSLIKISTIKSAIVPIAPTRIEAESYVSMSGVQLESCSEGGQNVGFTDTGDWMDYNLNLTPGIYKLTLRTASAIGGANILLKNGSSTLATFAVGNTGGWQSWQSLTSSPFVITGTSQTLRLEFSPGGCNVNWLEFQKQ